MALPCRNLYPDEVDPESASRSSCRRAGFLSLATPQVRPPTQRHGRGNAPTNNGQDRRARLPRCGRHLRPQLTAAVLKKETHHLSTGIRPPRVRVGSSGVATGPCVTEAMDNPLFHHLVAAFVGVHGAGITNAFRRPSSADRNPRVYCGPLSKYEWVGDHRESNELSLHPGQNPWTGGSEQFCSDCPSDCLI
jgi:hypothetical protein